MEWYIWAGIGIVGLIVALAIEDSREYILETLAYILSFEWFGDFWGFISSAFEDISEFSVYGLLFGILGAGVSFYFREQLINSFLQYYPPMQRIIWTIATYVGTFIGCYFLGRAFESN